VVLSGEAIGLEQLLQLNPADGDQVYAVAPEAFSCMLACGQMVAFSPNVRTGGGAMVMVMLPEPLLHPPVMLTVYVVVVVGTATGSGQFVQLNPVAGLHE
jgi:hypothetical protein